MAGQTFAGDIYLTNELVVRHKSLKGL